jgi:hypothetical protein
MKGIEFLKHNTQQLKVCDEYEVLAMLTVMTTSFSDAAVCSLVQINISEELTVFAWPPYPTVVHLTQTMVKRTVLETL